MKQKFNTHLLNEDLSYKTHTVNGHNNIIVSAENEYYDYEEIKLIAEKAVETARFTYGWSISHLDSDGQLKRVVLRGNTAEKYNKTTSSKDALNQWIDYLFDKDDRQTSLF